MSPLHYIAISLLLMGVLLTIVSLFFRSNFYALLKNSRKSPNEYLKVKVVTNLGENEKELIKKNKELLSINNVPLNKIYFVFTPIFSYDIDKKKINPEYDMLLPLRNDNSGLFDRHAPVIEVNKPKNLIRIKVNNYKLDNSYKVIDNYTFIKESAKKTKRGIVIYLNDDSNGVDSKVLCLIDLDDAVKEYII